jgi:hypothetical protein
MKKTSIAAAVTAGVIMLTANTYALASEMKPTNVLKTNDSDLTVMPGAGSEPVQLQFSGAAHLYANAPGELTVFKATGAVTHYRPVAYQMVDGKMKRIEVHFRIDSKNQATLQLGARDENAPVVLQGGAAIAHQPVLW